MRKTNVKVHEVLLPIRIKRLREGGFLATSEVLPGLIAEGRTIAETMEIARDVAKKVMETYREYDIPLPSSLKRVQTNSDVRIPVSLG